MQMHLAGCPGELEHWKSWTLAPKSGEGKSREAVRLSREKFPIPAGLVTGTLIPAHAITCRIGRLIHDKGATTELITTIILPIETGDP
jgi:hypothetical protein